VKVRAVWLLGLVAAASVAVRGGEDSRVKRGPLQHQGRLWVQEVRYSEAVPDGSLLLMQADVGSIRVQPGASGQLECVARLQLYAGSEAEARNVFDRFAMVVRRTNGGVYLSGRSPSGRRSPLCLAFDVRVPLRFNLNLETQGGNVDVGQLNGELRVVTAAGDVRTGDVTGPVRVETAGGSVDLGNIGHSVEAHSAGGRIHVGDIQGDATLETSAGDILAGVIRGRVRAQTAGGDIVVRAAQGPVMAQTEGGQIQLGQCGASVRARTAAGSIHLAGARGLVEAQTAGGGLDLLQLMSAVRAETAAGPILAQIDASPQTFRNSSLESSAGDIQVLLPPTLPVTLSAVINNAAGHRILTDFPVTVGSQQYGLASGEVHAHGAVAGGGPLLNLRANMGNIEIRKMDAHTLARLKQAQDALWKSWQVRWQDHQEQLRQLREQLHTLEEAAEKAREQLRQRAREQLIEHQERPDD
jgi:hypothetical protein